MSKKSGFQSTFQEKMDWLKAHSKLFIEEHLLLSAVKYDTRLDKKLIPIFDKMKKEGLYAPVTKPESVLPNLLVFIQKVAADLNHLRVGTHQQKCLVYKAKDLSGQINVLLKAATYNAQQNNNLEFLYQIQEHSIALENMLEAFLENKEPPRGKLLS